MVSNLSDLGFTIQNKEEYFELAEKAYTLGKEIKVKNGRYVEYRDNSGIELWVQMDNDDEFMGLNPHFTGKSRRKVKLTEIVDRPDSELDGAYNSWAILMSSGEKVEELFPFIFDLPDFQISSNIALPKSVEIQLTAFAKELVLHKDETDFFKGQKDNGIKLSPRSFISNDGNLDTKEVKVVEEAFGAFSGYISEYKKIKNELTGNEFYWFLIDTLGGEIDMVADPQLINIDPVLGGIVQGQFWFSGRIINS